MSTRSVKSYSPIAARVGIPGLRPVVGGLVRTLTGWRGIRRVGVGNVPATGGLLIVANHISDFDPIALQYACPRPIHFMAKQELFEMRGVGAVIRFFQAFPIRRGEPDKGALRYAIDLLKAGECVGIFPEGRLSETGELLPLAPGVALVARSAGVPVLPCRLRGTNGFMPYGKVVPQSSPDAIEVEFGMPRTFDHHESADAILTWMASELAASPTVE